MFRKDPKDEENESSTSPQETTPYSTPRNYSSYQSSETPRPTTLDASASPKALTESESLAREIKDGTLSGFIGSGTVVTGEANFKAMLRVDGHLSGRVNSETGTLIIGSHGQVDANIEVATATIHGTVNGDIVATQRLELGRAAKVNGNIQTPSLMIEQGAIFEGSCKMIQPSAALEKGRKRDYRAHEENALDTSDMQPINADNGADSSDVVSDVAS
jgi:cytoskeletal protein CcmA (bactofilin family)